MECIDSRIGRHDGGGGSDRERAQFQNDRRTVKAFQVED